MREGAGGSRYFQQRAVVPIGTRGVREMASCEKCWRDAGGDPVLFAELVESRTGTENECTPEQQAGGEDAKMCPTCDRKCVHSICDICMNPDCDDHYIEDK